jgi:hypothetical protein
MKILKSHAGACDLSIFIVQYYIMNSIASYGLGAGMGIAEYFAIKTLMPPTTENPTPPVNLTSAILGVGMIAASIVGVTKNADAKRVLIGNGVSLVAVSALQAGINPSAMSAMHDRSYHNNPYTRYENISATGGCSACNKNATNYPVVFSQPPSGKPVPRSQCPKCWPPRGVYE